MTTVPTPKPVKIYDQNDLFDFSNSQGAIRELLGGEIAEGNKVVIMQFPINAGSTVIRVLETHADIAAWMAAKDEAKQRLQAPK